MTSRSPLSLRDEGCCRITWTPRGSKMPAGWRGSGPGSSGRHGAWFGLCWRNHSLAGRRNRHGGIQLHRHAGEREGTREAAAATAAELRADLQSAETETAPNALYPGAAQRAGAQFRQNALPRHLHEGGTGTSNRPHRVQSSGKNQENTNGRRYRLPYIFSIMQKLETVLSIQRHPTELVNRTILIWFFKISLWSCKNCWFCSNS